MKKHLTKESVKYALHLLVEANGMTTTLEVKNLLRELGYKAKQKEVSEFADSVFEQADFLHRDFLYRELNPTQEFFIYTHNLKFDELDLNFETTAEELRSAINELSDETIQSAIDIFNSSIQLEVADNPLLTKIVTNNSTASIPGSDDLAGTHITSGVKINNPSKLQELNREPEYIVYTDNDLKSFQDSLSGDKWVVFHKNENEEYHIYNSELTRDQVRSRYASILGTKIQDVRSRKLSNF